MSETSYKVASNVDSEFMNIVNSVPEKLRKLQGILQLDPFILADNYFASDKLADVSIDPNANMSGKSPVSFQSEIFKPQLKLRSFYEIWKRLKAKHGSAEAKELLIAMLDGSLYFHDITKIDIPYCFAFDTSFLATQGRPYGWLPGKAPTRSSSFIGQLVETTMDWSQQLAGAIGLANILINLAYFTNKERAELIHQLSLISVREDQILAIKMYMGSLSYQGSNFTVIFDNFEVAGTLDDLLERNIDIHDIADAVYDKYVENLLQQYVHTMHNTFRVGGDSPFTNLSIFDKFILGTVFKDATYPDFTKATDNIPEIMRVQKIYVNFFVKGSPITGKKYRFPVSTINIKKFTSEDAENGLCDTNKIGKIADEEFFKWICGKNLARGTFNIHVGEKIATCCRLTSDLSVLKDQVRMDSFGNGGLSIGSHRVVAINHHRVALKAKYDEYGTFEEELGYHMAMAEKILVCHKELLEERVKAGFLQFFNIGWCDLKMFFSTYGYTGLWDAYNVIKETNAEENLEDYAEWASGVLDNMEKHAKISGKNHAGYAFNVEEIPGENASPKMAMMDNFIYKDKADYVSVELLANQMVPLYVAVPLFDRLKTQGLLMNKVSGGAILHLNLTDSITPASNEEFIRMMIEDYNIPHFAINIGSSTCVNNHTIAGIHEKCPECDGEISTYTIRVVGFDTDTSDWIEVRRDWEMKQRQFYTSQNLLK